MSMSEAGSLSRLRDIVVPEPVSWWPVAPGWWVLTVFLVLAIAYASWRVIRVYRANAYRREALGLLEDAGTDAEISAVLKRAAMAAFGRDEVASLSGEAWCRWLDVHVPGQMSAEVCQAFEDGIYGEAGPRNPVLLSYAEQWIRQHDRPALKDGKEVGA